MEEKKGSEEERCAPEQVSTQDALKSGVRAGADIRARGGGTHRVLYNTSGASARALSHTQSSYEGAEPYDSEREHSLLEGVAVEKQTMEQDGMFADV